MPICQASRIIEAAPRDDLLWLSPQQGDCCKIRKSCESEVPSVARNSLSEVRGLDQGQSNHRSTTRHLLMTGGTSGIGRRALGRLLRERPEWRVFLLARQSPRSDALKSLPGAAERLAIIDADLASLASVDAACD